MGKLQTFLTMSHSQKWLILQTIVLLPCCQLSVRFFSLKRLISIYGLQQGNDMLPNIATINSLHQTIATEISWAVNTVDRAFPYLPGACFAQALLARFFLSRRGIASKLYLGAKITNEGKTSLKAHAWLTVNDQIVTGKSGQKSYSGITCFT